MKGVVVKFDPHQRSVEDVLEIAKRKEYKEVMVIGLTGNADKGGDDEIIHIQGSRGFDRLRMMGGLFAGAIQRWDEE